MFLFIISLFFEFYIIIDLGGGRIDEGRNLGVDFFFLRGLPYIILIILSIVLMYLLRIDLAIIFGVASSVLMALNLFIFFIPEFAQDEFKEGLVLSYTFLWGYYLAILIWVGICFVNLTLIKIKFVRSNIRIKLIKKTVIELGTQFANLELDEISEACNINQVTVLKTVKTMIENREIYAEYFNSSKSVAFNKQANIEEIDLLMNKYRDWEGKI